MVVASPPSQAAPPQCLGVLAKHRIPVFRPATLLASLRPDPVPAPLLAMVTPRGCYTLPPWGERPPQGFEGQSRERRVGFRRRGQRWIWPDTGAMVTYSPRMYMQMISVGKKLWNKKPCWEKGVCPHVQYWCLIRSVEVSITFSVGVCNAHKGKAVWKNDDRFITFARIPSEQRSRYSCLPIFLCW